MYDENGQDYEADDDGDVGLTVVGTGHDTTGESNANCNDTTTGESSPGDCKVTVRG